MSNRKGRRYLVLCLLVVLFGAPASGQTVYQTYPGIGGVSTTYGSDGSVYQTYPGIGGVSTTYEPGGSVYQTYPGPRARSQAR